jgi:hypothetical protein
MSDLEMMVDEAVFVAWQKSQPRLIDAVRDLLRQGETPTQIERRLRRSFGKSEITRQVRSIAEYLKRTQV